MIRNILFVIISALFLATLIACSSSDPSESVIQTAIAQTQEAPDVPETEEALVADNEADPTETPSPTATPKPRVSCRDDDVETYLEELEFMMEEWDDTVTIAESTSRMSLAPIIQDMQNIKRDARRLDRPECAVYLQDLVTLAMESEITALLAFLTQESDTVVSRKMNAALTIRETVDQELEAFQADAMDAYLKSNVSADTLEEEASKAEPFLLPDGWIDTDIPDSDLTISHPEDWTPEVYGSENQFLSLDSPDGELTILLGAIHEGGLTEFESDAGRLLMHQLANEDNDYSYYNERSAEIGVYNENKGYMVEYTHRENSGDDITAEIVISIITNSGDEVFMLVSTTNDEFSQIDRLIFGDVFGSIRHVSADEIGGE